MIRTIAPIIFSLGLGLLLSFSANKILKVFIRRFWKRVSSGIPFRYIVFVLILSAMLWLAGKLSGSATIMLVGASVLAVSNLSGLLLTVTLPIPLMIDLLIRKYRNSVNRPTPISYDPSRRYFLKTSATAFPALALGTAGTGMAGSFQSVRMPEKELYFRGLSDDLDGFRILHLTDLHLGYYFNLPDLEETLQLSEQHHPDLILVTGDIADDLRQLPEALERIDQAKSRYGAFASLGNHEYIRNINEVRDIFKQSAVPLLVNDHAEVRHKDSTLVIAGIDDPRTMRGDITDFLDQSIGQSLTNAPENGFRVLMSHRPRALDVAAGFNIDLVLAGHTHGGQVGLYGKSLFEGMVEREPYMWGLYKNQSTQLYTSAGLGHWFPFRLNCPPEAPVIILRKI
jgi:predicted MPP superfamily phosphohydrolase